METENHDAMTVPQLEPLGKRDWAKFDQSSLTFEKLAKHCNLHGPKGSYLVRGNLQEKRSTIGCLSEPKSIGTVGFKDYSRSKEK